MYINAGARGPGSGGGEDRGRQRQAGCGGGEDQAPHLAAEAARHRHLRRDVWPSRGQVATALGIRGRMSTRAPAQCQSPMGECRASPYLTLMVHIMHIVRFSPFPVYVETRIDTGFQGSRDPGTLEPWNPVSIQGSRVPGTLEPCILLEIPYKIN